MYSLLTCLWSGDDIVGWAPFVLFVYLGRIIESLYTILKDEAAQKKKKESHYHWVFQGFKW